MPVPLVKDVMTTDPVSIPQTALIDAAIEVMLTHNVSGLPVVDDWGRLVGLITEYDVLSLFDQSDADARRLEPCSTYMKRDVRTIGEHASIAVAATIFRSVSIRRLLVVSGERLVGIISRRDIVRTIRDRRVALAGH